MSDRVLYRNPPYSVVMHNGDVEFHRDDGHVLSVAYPEEKAVIERLIDERNIERLRAATQAAKKAAGVRIVDRRDEDDLAPLLMEIGQWAEQMPEAELFLVGLLRNPDSSWGVRVAGRPNYYRMAATLNGALTELGQELLRVLGMSWRGRS